MRERRALRFLVEALFLGLLAAALVVADLEPLAIGGIMAAGWLVVALYEWAATRELPHYGRGMPPRYYVPQVKLPPARQLEQLRSGYPAAPHDDEATWIATPAMRAEALREWPLDPAPGPMPAPEAGEDTMVVDNLLLVAAGEEFHEDTWVELDPAAEGRDSDVVAVAVVEEEPEVAEPEPVAVEPEPIPEPEPVAIVEPEPIVEVEPEVLAVAAVVAAPELPEVEEPEESALDRDAAVVAAAVAAVLAEPEPAETEPVAIAEPEPEPEPVEEHDAGVAVVAAAAAAVLAEPAPIEDEPIPVAIAEPEPEPEPVDEHDTDAVVVAAAVAAVLTEPEPPEPERAEGVDAGAAVVAAAVAAVVVAEPDVEVAAEEEEETEEDVVVAAVAPEPVALRPARHTFDPLADAAPTRRRWRKRDDPWVEMPAKPPTPTTLPSRPRREP